MFGTVGPNLNTLQNGILRLMNGVVQKLKNDLKPSGKFSWRMEAKDGSMGFDFTGDYEKIIEKQLITYKMSDGRLVRIDFSENGNKVIVSETFDAEGTNSDEQQRAGWQAILGNFKNYVESKR